MAEGTSKVAIEERIARTRETFEAMARADLDKILEGFAEDAVWHSELRSSDFRGTAAIRAEELRQLDEFTGSMTLHDVCASSDHVVCAVRIVSRNRRRAEACGRVPGHHRPH